MKDKLSASKAKVRVRAKAKAKTSGVADTTSVISNLASLSGYSMELWLTDLVLRLVTPQPVLNKKLTSNHLSNALELEEFDKLLSFKTFQATQLLAKDFEKVSRHILPDMGALISSSLTTSNSVALYLYYLKKLETGKAKMVNNSKTIELQYFVSRLNELSPHLVISVYSDLITAKSAAKKDQYGIKKSTAVNYTKSVEINKEVGVQTTATRSWVQPQCVRELHNLLEMAFINGCSYVKIGAHRDEIEHAIYDYLYAKTFHSVEARVKVELYQPDISSVKAEKPALNLATITSTNPEVQTITEACIIKISLEVRWFGLEMDFVRMMGMNNFRLRPITNVCDAPDTPNTLKTTKSKVKASTSSAVVGNQDLRQHQYLKYFDAFEVCHNQIERVMGTLVTELSIALNSKKSLAIRKVALKKVEEIIKNSNKPKSPRPAKSTEPISAKKDSFKNSFLKCLNMY